MNSNEKNNDININNLSNSSFTLKNSQDYNTKRSSILKLTPTKDVPARKISFNKTIITDSIRNRKKSFVEKKIERTAAIEKEETMKKLQTCEEEDNILNNLQQSKKWLEFNMYLANQITIFAKDKEIFFDFRKKRNNLEETPQILYKYAYIDTNPQYFLDVIELSPIEKIMNYKDSFPLLRLRKFFLLKIQKYKEISLKIIKTPLFENLILLIILINSVILAIYGVETSEKMSSLETFFLVVYTVEFFLKVFAMGFVRKKKSYLRDAWNVLDFLILLSIYLPEFFKALGYSSNFFNLSVLRSFRVLRPLRTISNIKSLRMILAALFSAINLLEDTAIFLMFFYMIFAIAGLQLFMGYLKHQCFSSEIGVVYSQDNPIFCSSDSICPNGYICGKQIDNDFLEMTNFDTFLYSFLQIFKCVALEGWGNVLTLTEQTFSPWVFLFFLSVTLIGGFFLMNLTLAIIKVKFSEKTTEDENQKEIVNDSQNDFESYSLDRVKEINSFLAKRKKMREINTLTINLNKTKGKSLLANLVGKHFMEITSARPKRLMTFLVDNVLNKTNSDFKKTQ